MQGQGYHNHNSRASASCNMPPVVQAPYQGTVQVGDRDGTLRLAVCQKADVPSRLCRPPVLLAVDLNTCQSTALLMCHVSQLLVPCAGRSDRKGSDHTAVSQCIIAVQPHSSQPRCGHVQHCIAMSVHPSPAGAFQCVLTGRMPGATNFSQPAALRGMFTRACPQAAASDDPVAAPDAGDLAHAQWVVCIQSAYH